MTWQMALGCSIPSLRPERESGSRCPTPMSRSRYAIPQRSWQLWRPGPVGRPEHFARLVVVAAPEISEHWEFFVRLSDLHAAFKNPNIDERRLVHLN